MALACRSLARTVMRGGERGVVEAGGARAVMGCLSEQVELLLRAMDGKQASGEAFKVRLSEAHPRVQIKSWEVGQLSVGSDSVAMLTRSQQLFFQRAYTTFSTEISPSPSPPSIPAPAHQHPHRHQHPHQHPHPYHPHLITLTVNLALTLS